MSLMQFDKDLNSDYAELFLDVRAFITQHIEIYSTKVVEKYSPNITTIYTKELKSAFCYIRVKNAGVHIGWMRGSHIADRFSLLFGDGKQIRGQSVTKLDKKTQDAIAYYVKETYYSLVEKYALK